MKHAVVFDIDNTLYSYDAAHGVAWQALAAYAGEALGLSAEAFEALHRAAARTQAAHAGGSFAAIHNRLIRCQLMLEAAGLPLTHAPAMEKRYWNALLDAMAPYPGVSEAFAQIKAMGMTLGIGTNMTADWQFEKLERLGLLRHVDFMVCSEEVSAEKPDRRLFDCCAEKAGRDPGDCVFVGDSLKGDVLGALNAGFRAVWYAPQPDAAETPSGACRIRDFGELPPLLASL